MLMLRHVLFAYTCLCALFQALPVLAFAEALDPGFGNGGIAFLTPNGVDAHEYRVSSAISLPDGKLLLAGSRNRYEEAFPADPHVRAMLARLNADGSADNSFGSDAASPGTVVLPDIVAGTEIQSIEAVQRLDDGSIVVVGTAQAFGPLTAFVAKLDANGAMDSSFGSDGDGVVRLSGKYFHALGIDSLGRLIAAGEETQDGVLMHGFIARFNLDGTLDATFGIGGVVVPGPDEPDHYSYVNALVVTSDDGVLVGGFREIESPDAGDAYWIARVDSNGQAEAAFGDAGSRSFRIPGSASTYNAIQRLLVLESGAIVFGAYYMSDASGTALVLGRLAADGSTDASFGDQVTPGFQRVDVVPGMGDRYFSGLARLPDGKLLATINYYTSSPAKQTFMAVRTSQDGIADSEFAENGVFAIDLAPDGVYSSVTALAVQDGQPILAGSSRRDPTSRIVDLAVVRSASDRIFSDGFDTPASVVTISSYDGFAEGFLGTSFTSEGVTYRELNEVAGEYPDGVPFAAGELGNQFIIENATLLYADFPDFGSAPNALTFGAMYVNGDNLTIGALASAWLDFDHVSNAVSMDLAYYENGPWGGVEIGIDAYRGGSLVGSSALTVLGVDPSRDNVAIATLSIDGVEFDSLHLRATLDGMYTAPRVMIDSLAVSQAAVTQP